MSIDKKKIGKILKVTAIGTGVTFLGLNMIAKKKKGDSVFEKEKDQKNPFAGKKVVFVEDESDEENADGVRGHLEAVGETKKSKGIYDRYIKRAIDVVLSFGGLVVLSPIYAGIAIAIKIDDPGPVFFTQKRVGQNKEFFKIHKFRSMKMSTPHDVPTHMLGDPDQYITRVGKFLRKHSLDELPQIWDIFIGNMSVIGPRPALWNQDVLIAEREKYNANDVKPGLTGWAQINGRDELEIPVKAKLDGEYVEKESLFFDIKCFLGTIGKVAKDDSVVEGGTGEMGKQEISEAVKLGRIQRMKRVITYGTFDLLHYGHINLLRRAKALGDYLIVVISSDEFNWNEKKKKCYFTYEQRKALVEAIRYVDLVIPETCWEQKKTDVHEYHIDTFVMGDDWKGKFDFLKEEGVEVVYLSRTPEISTTQIKSDLNRKVGNEIGNCSEKNTV